MKHKINLDNIPDEFKGLLKEEMTNDELSQFGVILLKHKISSLKQKLFGWFYAKKNKRNNK